MNIMKKQIKEIALSLTFGMLLFPVSLSAENLTPQQQQSLRTPDYNPGSLLMQRMKELQRYNTDNEAYKLKENAERQEEEPQTVEGRPEAPAARCGHKHPHSPPP